VCLKSTIDQKTGRNDKQNERIASNVEHFSELLSALLENHINTLENTN